MFGGIFRGSDGSVSTTRVVTVLSVAVVLGIYIVQNIISMHAGKGYVDFPANTVMVLLVTLGAKVGQHISENAFKEKASMEPAEGEKEPTAADGAK